MDMVFRGSKYVGKDEKVIDDEHKFASITWNTTASKFEMHTIH
jgi:hypothetical protein